MLLQRSVDAAQYLHQVGAGTAAGVQDIDIGVRQTIRQAKLLAQHRIYPRHHILDDLRRGVPDTQLFPELRVEGLQEGFIEVLDRPTFLEGAEEVLADYSVQDCSGPVQDLHQPQGPQAGGSGNVGEQRLDHGNP